MTIDELLRRSRPVSDWSGVTIARWRLPDFEPIAVAFSGGKDSLACVLHLLELGVPKERIELWHHLIDPPGQQFMDWPVTPAYCKAVADALDLPIYFSWKEGGFLRELLRENEATAPVGFETPSGRVIRVGGKGPPGTRRRFPQVSADLSVRWCSAYLKIDVAARVITNDPRLDAATMLLVTGERAEESPGRARYAEAEQHKTTTRRRLVVQWRPVLRWPESEVWEIIERWRINPHPAYRLGWGRLSCMSCIFGDPRQWRAVQQIAPRAFARIAAYEQQFGTTISREGNVVDRARWAGAVALPPSSAPIVASAMSEEFTEPVVLPSGAWLLPAGAFKRSGGPT
jgi:3'-phosphoadenosine 5'-phosphosulfate sulfotransferase (PAPS reductase)/FAD synthetase